jgi:hypothetical protein
VSENIPMTLAWLHYHTVGLSNEDAAELKDFVQAARFDEDLRMSRNSGYAAQYLERHPEIGLTVNQPIKPIPAYLVVSRIGPESVHENVDVREHHGLLITSSRSQDRLRSTPGRTPPVALDTGKWTRFDGAALRSARIIAKPSSIREVNVRPSSDAFFFARFKSSSLILTVVLMHQSISLEHQYVKGITHSYT